MAVFIKASAVPQGQFFRKRRGEYVYLRISESSLKFMKVDTTKVYGVCFNGNVAVVGPDTLVEPCSLSDFTKNIDDDRAWHTTVGARLNPVVDDPYELDK